MRQPQMEYEIVGGRLYGRDTLSGEHASIALRDVASRMAARGGYSHSPDELEVLDHFGTVGWKLGSRLKKAYRKVRKVAKPIVRVAKKVVKNKVFQGVMMAAAAAIPPPGNVAVIGVTAGIKAAQRIKATVKDAKQVAKIGRAAKLLADKKVKPKDASKLAAKVGVPAKELKSIALARQAQTAARKGDKKARAILKVSQIAREGTPKQAAALRQKLAQGAKGKPTKGARVSSAAPATSAKNSKVIQLHTGRKVRVYFSRA